MENQETGASNEGADKESPQSEETNESTDGENSEDGSQESADHTQKQIDDQNRHIGKLEKENKELRNTKSVSTDPDDSVDWKILHSSDIQACGDEYLKEVKFFKDQGVKITPEVLEKALSTAKYSKGLVRKEEVSSTPEQGEERKGKKVESVKPVPEWAIRSGWTQEKWDERVEKTKAEKAGV